MAINVLDKSIYNRISAGEVVESPFSVVKELIENSIDAGATKISVKLRDGGKEFISVTDNGDGIEGQDLTKAFMPHATSKITTVDDLYGIITLGFRGEALASIASVSRIKMQSKNINENDGYEIEVEGGVIGTPNKIDIEYGTHIEVSDLFYNTPARLKFLKTARQEENQILSMVTKLALANSHISFVCMSNDKCLIQTFGCGLLDAMICVYGGDDATKFINIETEINGIELSGFISPAYLTKSNTSCQTAIVNGRYVVNKTISMAINNAYKPLLMKRQYPMFCLHIDLDEGHVDVNATPCKTDVRFLENDVVYKSIYSTISKVINGEKEAEDIIVRNGNKTLSGRKAEKLYELQFEEAIAKGLSYKDNEYAGKDFLSDEVPLSSIPEFYINNMYEKLPEEIRHQSSYIDDDDNENDNSIDMFLENKKYIEQMERDGQFANINSNELYNSSLDKIIEEPQVKSPTSFKESTFTEVENYNLVSNHKIVGQILGTYIIIEKDNAMYLIDQHAGHERVLYDKILKAYTEKKLMVQPYIMPEFLDFSVDETGFLIDQMDYLRQVGIAIDEYGDNCFKISAVPLDVLDIDLRAFFNDLLTDLNYREITVPDIIREKLIQKACKSAVKAGDKLSNNEMQVLLDLINDNFDLKCPHGRPIAVKFTRTDIDKWFKRIL